MRTPTLVLITLLVAAFLVGACGPTTIHQAAPPATRSLTVNGTGQVYLTPDIAYIYIGVHTEHTTAAEAVATNTAETQKVIAALKEAGIEDKDIQTTNFSIWPNTQYNPEGQQIGVSYAVDNSVYVTVRNLDNLGDLLDAAISAGANSINSIQFDAADKSEALKQARDAALENARTQAQELAAAADVKLGEIQSISFYDTSAAPYFDTFGSKGGGGGIESAAVPIQPGQLALTVTVSMTYEIK
ncbi:MAG: SIMPL domain-containing protein [Anaerolineales bacterium]